MPSSLFKLHFGFHGLRDLFPKDSMSTSFFGQELQRALKEQGLAVQNYKILNASPLQASARVKLLEGHSINITLTQQGYNVGILQPLSLLHQAYRSCTSHRSIVKQTRAQYKSSRPLKTSFGRQVLSTHRGGVTLCLKLSNGYNNSCTTPRIPNIVRIKHHCPY